MTGGRGAAIGIRRRRREIRGLRPAHRVLGFASAGVAPRVMGVGPIPAVERLVTRLRLKVSDFDVDRAQ